MYKRPAWLEDLVSLPDIHTNIKSFGGHKQKVAKGWRIERESHFAFEIIRMISGTQKTYFQDRSEIFHTGDMILIPPGLEHENECISEEGMEYFCIHFDIDDPHVKQQLLLYCPIKLRKEVSAYQRIEQTIDQYIASLERPESGLRQRLHVKKLLINLLTNLLDYADAESKDFVRLNNRPLLLGIIIAETIQNNFKKYIENPKIENLYLLSLQTTANLLNISESTMLKQFKSVYSISPQEYLNQLRFNEAKYLLHQPNITISEIAEVVGYQNVSHFSRQFKKWKGLSPNQYRKKLMNPRP